MYSRSLVTAYVRAKHSVPTEDEVHDGGHAARVLGSVEAKALRAQEDLLTGASQLASFNRPASPQRDGHSAPKHSPQRRVITGTRAGRRNISSDDVLASLRHRQSGSHRLELLPERSSPGVGSPVGSPASHSPRGVSGGLEAGRSGDGVAEVREAIRRMEAAREADARALEELKSLCRDIEASPQPSGSARGSAQQTRTASRDSVSQRRGYTQSIDSVTAPRLPRSNYGGSVVVRSSESGAERPMRRRGVQQTFVNSKV